LCKTGKLVKEKISDQWPLKTNGIACRLTFDPLSLLNLFHFIESDETG